MSEVVIDKFTIDGVGHYQLFYVGKRFYFTLIPSYDILKKKYGKSALFYVDDETMDDVGLNKNPFETVNRIVNSVVDYVNKSRYTVGIETIKNFSFSSSTERKDKIYEHYVKRIVQKLDGDWDYTTDGTGFYFFLKE